MSKKNLPYKFTNLAYGEYADYCKCPSCNREMIVPCGVTICPICGEELLWADDDEPELPSVTPSEPIQATITNETSLYSYNKETTLKGELIAYISKAVDNREGMIDLTDLDITIPCFTENGVEYMSKSLIRKPHGIVLEDVKGDNIPIEILTAETLMCLDMEIENASINDKLTKNE